MLLKQSEIIQIFHASYTLIKMKKEDAKKDVFCIFVDKELINIHIINLIRLSSGGN